MAIVSFSFKFKSSKKAVKSSKLTSVILQAPSDLACVASVPARSENSARAYYFFVFGMRDKLGESKKVEGKGWSRGKKRTLARKPLDFEKPVRPRTGLLIGAAWSS